MTLSSRVCFFVLFIATIALTALFLTYLGNNPADLKDLPTSRQVANFPNTCPSRCFTSQFPARVRCETPFAITNGCQVVFCRLTIPGGSVAGFQCAPMPQTLLPPPDILNTVPVTVSSSISTGTVATIALGQTTIGLNESFSSTTTLTMTTQTATPGIVTVIPNGTERSISTASVSTNVTSTSSTIVITVLPLPITTVITTGTTTTQTLPTTIILITGPIVVPTMANPTVGTGRTSTPRTTTTTERVSSTPLIISPITATGAGVVVTLAPSFVGATSTILLANTVAAPFGVSATPTTMTTIVSSSTTSSSSMSSGTSVTPATTTTKRTTTSTTTRSTTTATTSTTSSTTMSTTTATTSTTSTTTTTTSTCFFSIPPAMGVGGIRLIGCICSDGNSGAEAPDVSSALESCFDGCLRRDVGDVLCTETFNFIGVPVTNAVVPCCTECNGAIANQLCA